MPTPPEPTNDPGLFEAVVNLSKRRGFVFPSAEIYGGIRSTYDYGPLGALMLRNVREAWWRAMIQERDDVVPIEAAILTNPKVWEASGHLATFTDPLVDCRNCKERWRADQIDDTCPNCGSKDLTEARPFNLMFKTFVGPVEEDVRRRLPATRDGAGHVRQLRELPHRHETQATVRDRPDRPERSATRSPPATSSSAPASSR